MEWRIIRFAVHFFIFGKKKEENPNMFSSEVILGFKNIPFMS